LVEINWHSTLIRKILRYTRQKNLLQPLHNISGEIISNDTTMAGIANKSRGLILKQGICRAGDETTIDTEVEIIDVSDYQPKRIASKTWRECIKKIWEADPLRCPKCGGEMKIISFITDSKTIRKILEHLDLWTEVPSRAPPPLNQESQAEVVYEPFDDGWPGFNEITVGLN
jgi:hypothetical protein